MISTELTQKLDRALKRIGRTRTGISVDKHPDGSIMAMRNGIHVLTLETGNNQVKSFSDSTVKKWANKIDSHFSRCARGDYHEQNRELREYNRVRDERRKINRRQEFIHQYEINKEKLRKRTLYFY